MLNEHFIFYFIDILLKNEISVISFRLFYPLIGVSVRLFFANPKTQLTRNL